MNPMMIKTIPALRMKNLSIRDGAKDAIPSLFSVDKIGVFQIMSPIFTLKSRI